MICEPEAQQEIYDSATGVKTTSVTTPTWTDHVYSCDYLYPGGVKIGMSVKELSNEAETTAYFQSLATKLHKTKDIPGLGQGAFQTADGSVVVRKDYKVLTIDVSKLPDQFGVPAAHTRRRCHQHRCDRHGVLDRRVIARGSVPRGAGPTKRVRPGRQSVKSAYVSAASPCNRRIVDLDVGTRRHGTWRRPSPPPRHPAMRGRTPAHLRPTGRGGRG